jgi:hypothetical protein
MNFEVGGRKAYKGARRQNLGSNWERIERSEVQGREPAAREPASFNSLQQLGKN